MHSLLEEYLSKLEAQLSTLPTKQRTEELHEMRVHLENAVSVCRERGQSEDEVMRAVVAQFGSPEAVGQETVVSWRRGIRLNRRSFWSAASVTTLMLCLAFFLMNSYIGLLANVLPHWFLVYCNEHQSCGMAVVQGLFFLAFGLAGLFAGILFPRRAIYGVCLGLAWFWTGWVAVDGVGHGGLLSFLFGNNRMGWVLVSIASAWVGSQLRLAHTGRLARS